MRLKARDFAQIVAGHLGMMQRVGLGGVLLGFDDQPARVTVVRQDLQDRANIDAAFGIAGNGENSRLDRFLEGQVIPEHLLQAGRLRLAHRSASLEELGQMSDPVLTKDAVAGRIRRLLAMADKFAADTGIPDTTAALTEDMLED